MLHSRLQIDLKTASVVNADTFKTNVSNRILPTDKWIDEDAYYSKNQDIFYFLYSGSYNLIATYLFKDSTKALQVYDAVKIPISGITGRISLHFCPVEGSISDWKGCKDDLRAGYVESIWP